MQAISRHLTVTDATSARQACRSWADGTPLPRIRLTLQPSSTSINKQQQQQHQTLLHSMQQPGSCSRMARQCVINVPASDDISVYYADQVDQLQHGGLADTCPQGSAMSAVEQLAAVVAQMPCLESLLIKTQHSQGNSSSGSSNSAMVSSILEALLAQGLQHKLQALSLNVQPWPSPQELSTMLCKFTSLKSLQLQQCPVAVICSLPSLPQLCQLSISGLLTEPIPRSYSYKQQGLLLPLLSSLQKLVLRNMPLDLRVQELDDIQQQQLLAAHRQCGCQRGSNSSGCQGRKQFGQWVGSSIVRQCPNLQELSTDMQLGPIVLQLTTLR